MRIDPTGRGARAHLAAVIAFGLAAAAGCDGAEVEPGDAGLPSSCFDRARDGDETGVDCGGPCEACATTSFRLGVDTILPEPYGGRADALVAEPVSLDRTATLVSLSIYVTNAAGGLRLGVYDASGVDGGPGELLASTAAFAPEVGWNTRGVLLPVALPPATYWLAFQAEDDALTLRMSSTGGTCKHVGDDFGVLPSPFSAGTPFTYSSYRSFYATLYAGE